MALIPGPRLPTLEGPRVRLRWLGRDDAPALHAIFSDPQVMRFWSRLPFEGEEEARELVEAIEGHFAAQSLFQWGVATKDNDGIIGSVTLSHVDADQRRAELGYALRRTYWRQGLMCEALEILLTYAFGELSMRRLEADVDPNNFASIRVLERLGFQRDGHLRERWFVGGQAQDSLLYGLLKSEWDSRQMHILRADKLGTPP